MLAAMFGERERFPGRRSPSFRGPAGEAEVGGLTPSDLALLERAPRRRRGINLPDLAGKVWNAPNTALGLGYGLAGYAVGQANRLRPGDQPDPRIQLGRNAVEFINNPAVPFGGLTVGNVTMYPDDPYDPSNTAWAGYQAYYGHPIQEHEKQHTYQGQRLGPFYLPSNLVGGLRALLNGERDDEGRLEWGGPSNWNERGPKLNPPRPWP